MGIKQSIILLKGQDSFVFRQCPLPDKSLNWKLKWILVIILIIFEHVVNLTKKRNTCFLACMMQFFFKGEEELGDLQTVLTMNSMQIEILSIWNKMPLLLVNGHEHRLLRRKEKCIWWMCLTEKREKKNWGNGLIND